MTWANSDRLYELLPAVYRARDGDHNEVLRVLLSIIQSEVETLETDIEGLYDNWFIETCAEWLVPYIGDLLGVRNLHTVDSAGIYSLRAYVANTLAYRQRKGTAAVLEQLAKDVTNWPARVVEYFQLLETTQHMNHVRLGNLRTPDIRDANQLELLDTPFDTAAHTGEVRRIDTRGGRYNIPNIGLYLWRLEPYFLSRTTPREVLAGRYTFSPLGLDGAIFNRPQTETAITHIATETNVPTPLRRRGVAKNKAAYLGDQPSFEVIVDDTELVADQIRICHLGGWEDAGWTPPSFDGTAVVAVDPQLGRLVVLEGAPTPESLLVSHTYAFSSDVGGGPYNRRDSLEDSLTRAVNWQVAVNQGETADGLTLFNTLADAIDTWHDQPEDTVGIIVITDSLTYPESFTGADKIQIKPDSQLTIVAGQWNGEAVGQVDADDRRPHILGNLTVEGLAPAGEDQEPGELVLNGLLIEGVVRVAQGDLGALQINHCTIVPGPDVLLATSQSNRQLAVSLDHTICGGIRLAGTVPELIVKDSIVENIAGDGTPGADIEAPGADVHIERSTVLGADDTTNTMRSLYASESIFSGRIYVERRQAGCVRFSYVTADSRVPRRYYCQPSLALDGVTDPAEQQAIKVRLIPLFTSRTYGDPAYCQLSQACAEEIRTGAEDGSEMGVFSHLKQPQREANLRAALDEYLRFGLSAGIFYST